MLYWLRGGCNETEWVNAQALVWSNQPIYCGASVHIQDKKYYINTAAWFGLSENDKESLEAYLKSLHLTPQERVQFCDSL